MIDKLREEDYNILVINALNGSFAIGLRKKFPRARIICAEHFTYFKSHLINLGFEVMMYDEINNDMKFDTILTNPPYLNGLWKTLIKFAYDEKLKPNSNMITVNPDPIESIGSQAKKWQEECRRMGLQVRRTATHHFPTVNSGPIGLFYHIKHKSYDPIAFNSGTMKHVIKNQLIANSKNNTVVRYAHLGKYDHLKKIEEKRKRKQKEDMKDHCPILSGKFTEPVIVGMVTSGVDVRYFEPSKIEAHTHTGSTFVMNRFFGQNSEAELIENIQNYKIGRKILYLQALPGETLESFKSVFYSKLYRFALKVMRDGHMDTRPTHLTQLFCPTLTRVYTDQELYQLNNITDPEQIAYIEQNYEGNK